MSESNSGKLTKKDLNELGAQLIVIGAIPCLTYIVQWSTTIQDEVTAALIASAATALLTFLRIYLRNTKGA